ncbi:MAG: DNA-processing protein DprA [Treponema sp.]|jgi:DNA processing protein|nr:DNA-processing protein DprA [Treponema sp.]
MNSAGREKLLGIVRVERNTPLYPPLLGEIFDPPAVLYVRGTLPNPERPAVALVGTRSPSSAACREALRLGREFARRGITVVSGLALGIDALAHRGCLEGGGSTVAVLGSSVDEVYPASNRRLARRILENGGALVSEYPCGTKPRKWFFPQRNRIISGFARGTVIVEAPASSGALYTGQFALEQGRDLFVASSGVSSPLGEGTRRLAADGCRIISAAEEVLIEWNISEADRAGPPEYGADRPGAVREAALSGHGAALSEYADAVQAGLADSLRQELGL